MCGEYNQDQLNRLKRSQGVTGLDADNTWHEVEDLVADRYKSEYWYDANGNIDTLARYDQDGHLYDGFSYKYKRDGEGRLLQNRLYQLNDLADEDDLYVNEGANGAKDIKWTGNVPFDPEDEAINTAYDYGYDELGNLVRDGREGIAEIDWTVAGKVRRVTMSTGRMLHFAYGTGGTRTLKQMGDPSHPSLPTGYREHYVRDAQGNIMAVYRYTNSGGASTRLVERPVYGSSRLGSYARPQEVMGPGLVSNQYTAPLQPASQLYELSDHLGNVSTVVTGRLLNGNGAGSVYQAEVMSASGVEPFGSLLPGRNHNSNRAVVGFNGMRKDDEVYDAPGTSYTAEFWQYDPRTGRRWNLDPVDKPWESPYLTFAGNPVRMVDPNGDNAWKPNSEGHLVAEAGDDLCSLGEYLGVTSEVAQKFACDQGFDVSQQQSSQFKEGDIIRLGGAYTKSIENSNASLQESPWGTLVSNADDYNCWGAAVYGSQGKEIANGCGYNLQYGSDFDRELKANYDPVQPGQAQFGRTLIRFEKNHAAVFYGRSHDGTTYVYSKNGWWEQPKIIKLTDVIAIYGQVEGMQQSNHTGYYTIR